MWLDGKEIPDWQVQDYLNYQRQRSREAGAYEMTKALIPMLNRLTDNISDLEKELSIQKRRATFYKNRRKMK